MQESGVQIGKKNDARDTIFASIRKYLERSRPFDGEWQEHHGHADGGAAMWEPIRTAMSVSELADLLMTNFGSLGVHCKLVADEPEAAKHVSRVIGDLKAKRIAISDPEVVGRIVRPDNGIEIVKNASADVLFDCDLGITSAQWAIAETGTLVLESDKESHRLTSLISPVHLCVINAACIRQTLGEILEITRGDLSRTMTFITGASRTSDIELTLAIGVHGPKELHVVIIAG